MRCAVYEPLSVRISVLLFLFIVLSSGASLLVLGSIDQASKKWQRLIAVWFVRRPSLFLLDVLGPIFGVCMGISCAALLSGYDLQAVLLVLTSLYIPAIALMNMTVSGLTKKQGLTRASELLREEWFSTHPRTVGILLMLGSVVLALLTLPLKLPDTGC